MAKKLFYETNEFKKLNAKWGQKLSESGFEDIESGEDSAIVRPQIIKTQKSQYIGGNQYFALCQEILRTFQFKRDLHRKIFELHTAGRSLREIEADLKKLKLKVLSPSGILKIIKRVKDAYVNTNPGALPTPTDK